MGERAWPARAMLATLKLAGVPSSVPLRPAIQILKPVEETEK